MKHLRILFFLLLFSIRSFAQGVKADNMIALSIINPLSISYNNIEEVKSAKVINNAFELKVKSASRGSNIYASLIFKSNNDNNPLKQSLALKLREKNSSSCQAVLGEVPLSNSPTFLLFQPTYNENNGISSLSYDFIVKPMYTFVKSGDYDFYINFTMTQP